MPVDPNSVGQDKPYKDAVDAHDASQGEYEDAIEKVSTDSRLPTTQMPKAPDPDPFVLGPTGG